MGRRIIDFGEKKTTQTEFYSDDNKKIFNINDINVFEILISNGYFLYQILMNMLLDINIITTSNR